MKTRGTKKRASNRSGQQGFTLLELMIVVAISSMIFYGIASVLRSGSSHANGLSIKTGIQNSAQMGLSKMMQEIREGSPDRMTLTADSVSFQIPSAVSNAGNITWTGNIQYALGGLNNTQLLRTAPDGTVTVIANDVQSVVFTADDVSEPRRVTTQINLQRTTPQGRPYTETISGEAMIRNE